MARSPDNRRPLRLRAGLLFVALGACACRGTTALVFEPPEGTRLIRSIELEGSSELLDWKIVRNGVEDEEAAQMARQTAPGFLPGGVETLAIEDRIVRRDGDVLKIERTFRELRGSTGLTAGWSDEHDGRVVTLRWASRTVPAEIRVLVGGTEPGAPEEILPPLLDFVELLPDVTVRPGDEWTRPQSALALRPTPIEEAAVEEGGVAMPRVLCRLEELVRDPAGQLARVSLSVNGETRYDTPDELKALYGDHAARMKGDVTAVATVEGDGELVWNVTLGVLHTFEHTQSEVLTVTTSNKAFLGLSKTETLVSTAFRSRNSVVVEARPPR